MVGRNHGPVAGERLARFLDAAHLNQEAGGFGKQRTEGNQNQSGGKTEQPHDPPAEIRLQQRR